ncbi:aldehyde dehydrogenase [Macroventuria anomochaeta]|uniref:Aldehyde dehydrogenase n=1 Tax=Macroventuria anomochaeta TaxID=301207 RepID=A0ACB6RUC4_9PLEO|nr:aldehyde dehydrogenase [Macroventuria anomochaeta]KAF2624487.1 aldehyde dehydrogenase [Macroventuria anomochaeta]
MLIQTLNINDRDVQLNTGLFIGGEFVKPKVDKTFPVEEPRTEKSIIEVSEGSANDVNIAFLLKLADLMERHFDDILAIEMLDTGKAKKQTANLDLPGSIGTLRYYAGEIPWNFPLLIFIWQIAPAIVTGNTVVIKSAETTPLDALYICGLIKEIGLPLGTINLHMDIDKVAFTGSTVTGRAVLRAAANSHLKKVTLELDGKSANIVFPDVDLEKAVAWSTWGINMNYGQTCHAGTRIYVHEDIYDKFTELFTAGMEEVTVGGNFDENTNQGPQNSKLQHNKIIGYLEAGQKEGATVALSGKAHEAPGGGYLIQPTIFTNVTPEMKIVKEEIFEPVVTVTKFKTEEEVLELANNIMYGLAAGTHTIDYQRAIRVTNKIKVGTAWINIFNLRTRVFRSAGYKESGIGRECGEAALENYTMTKAVFFKMGVDAPQ